MFEVLADHFRTLIIYYIHYTINYMSAEKRKNRSDAYITEIVDNPFTLKSDMDVYAAKAAARRERIDKINFQKSVSVANRLDFSGRNAML